MDNGFPYVINKAKEAGKVTLVGHTNPDGDVVGACFALALAFADMGVVPTVLLEPYGGNLKHLAGAEFLRGGAEMASDVVICLDCAARDRTGEFEGLLDDAVLTVSIDHHEQDGVLPFAHVNIIDTKAAATCEMLYILMDDAGISITKDIAAALYTGLCADTGGFRHKCTTPRTHMVAGKLLETGIDFYEIQRKAICEHSHTQALALSMSINNMRIIPGLKLAVSEVTITQMKSINATGIDFEGVVEYMLNTVGVGVSALLTERTEGLVNISLRSTDLNVREIAAGLNGGGHIHAAGGKCEGTLEEVTALVIESIAKAAREADVT